MTDTQLESQSFEEENDSTRQPTWAAELLFGKPTDFVKFVKKVQMAARRFHFG